MAHLLVVLFMQGLFVNSKYIWDYIIHFVRTYWLLTWFDKFFRVPYMVRHIHTDYTDKLLSEIHFLSPEVVLLF